MYYIIDLSNNTCIAKADTRLETLFRYGMACRGAKRAFLMYGAKLSFDQLNITGKDIIRKLETIPGAAYCVGGIWLQKHEYVSYLRRYQVLDDYGRPVDIRLWKEEIAAINNGEYTLPRKHDNSPAPRFRQDPAGWGRRDHYHRQGGGAMMRGQLRAQEDTADFEDEYSEYAPIVDKTAVRKRVTTMDVWNYAENKVARKHGGSKCWKDQCRNARQWARHKKHGPGKRLRETMSTDDGIDDAFPDDESTDAECIA